MEKKRERSDKTFRTQRLSSTQHEPERNTRGKDQLKIDVKEV